MASRKSDAAQVLRFEALQSRVGRGRGTRIVVTALALVIFGSAIAAYRTISQFLAASQWVTHSHEVLELIDEVHRGVAEAEASVRGYVITGDVEYVKAYDAAKSQIGAVLAALRDRVSDNPDQTARVAEMASAVGAKVAQLEQLGGLRGSEGFSGAQRAALAGEGKRLMDVVRTKIGALRDEESRLLHERAGRTAGELASARRLLLLTALLTAALLALAIALVERDIRRAERDVERESAARRESVSDRETQTRAVRDSIIDAIITIDEQGTIRTVNVATERLFGYRADELVGQNVKLLMPSPYREEHDGYLEVYRASGQRKIIGIGREVTARRKDGSIFPVDLAVSESQVEHRRLFTGVLRDLTDRKRADAELKELHRVVQERGRLADIGAVSAQIVHDLANPIAGLSMQAQRLARVVQRPAQSPDTLMEIADQILATIGRLDGLLGELRDFSRQQRLELTSVEPMQFLETVRDVWKPVAAARAIDLRLECRVASGALVVDAAKLFRVLDNLVKNAIEAIGRGPGEISIVVSPVESRRTAVRISVNDSGDGIPESVDVFRLFETTKSNGSGLGLSIARHIVEAHGGSLTFAARQPHGTVFHIDLPNLAPGNGAV